MAVLAGLAAFAAMPQNTDDGDRRECPGHYLSITLKKGNQPPTTVTELTLPAGKSQVPEFHDCQRFITTSHKYQGRYAIFAAFHLDTLDEQTQPDSLQPGTLAPSAGAVILASDSTWPRLGITTRFNCLYLTAANKWTEAYMVAVGEAEERCALPLSVAATSGANVTKLKVNRHVVDDFVDADYPPVARWDRSPEGVHFIGIKCGAAWCEVGPADQPFASPWRTVNTALSREARKVVRIKGWYDEQYLALPPSEGGGPSKVVGTITPHVAIATDRQDAYKEYVRSAVIHLPADIPGYAEKLGVRKGNNLLEIRRGWLGLWWSARVRTAGGLIMPQSVKHWSHSDKNFVIPATARWRWDSSDEGTWSRCLQGCCQVM